MNFLLKATGSEIFTPNQRPFAAAFKSPTHLRVCARQDDLQFIAYRGMGECLCRTVRGFIGTADGNGRAETPTIKSHREEPMMAASEFEQKKAVYVGEYEAHFTLNHPSKVGKDSQDIDRVVGSHENLTDALMGVYDSQIRGDKCYDRATRGRRLANTTYFESPAVGMSQALVRGMDLTAFIHNESGDPFDFTKSHMDRLKAEAREQNFAPGWEIAEGLN